MSDRPPAFDIFLCHNSRDKPAVEAIAGELRERGLRPWLDVWELRPGLPWQSALEEQIEAIRAAAVIVGPAGRGPWQELESQAFLRQLVNRGCPVIPVILRDCENVPKLPVFLEGMTWVDFRTESPDPWKQLIWGITGEQPGAEAAETTPPAATRVSIGKLPVTGEHFVGRDDELARLDAAWDDPAANVVSFVAFGGVGKSALVNRWLDRLAADGWRGAERVLGWPLYSQGMDAAGASSEAFTEFALDWLGYDGEPILSPWRKGEELARRVCSARTLLVLDGLEPLQHPPGAQTGRIKDPAVQALVRELAAKNPGLCLITTRLAVADVAGRAGADSVDLEQLPPAAGAELLRWLGVNGSDAELEAASEEFGGHGLALSLLGTYLRDVCDGDVRRRGEVPLLDEEVGQGDHARRVMQSYEEWLGKGPERQVLSLVGLFDRPAEADALAALRAEPVVPGLTEGIVGGEETRWRRTLAQLQKARLVARVDATSGVDAHPLVREYFAERLREERPEAWRAGHERLYEHYKQAAPEFPETLVEMLPLYAAVVHGCRAGRVQEALDEVYTRRIQRGGEFFSAKKLGALGAELMALASFFDRPWDRPSALLATSTQAFVMNEAGYDLQALGRLPEAVEPMREGLEALISEKAWRNAAIQAGNLSDLTLTLGELASAVQIGRESVALADRSGHWRPRTINRAIWANALHQTGRWEESAVAFREAEAMQAEQQPQLPRLTSLGGYQYCDLLMGRAEPEDGSGLEGVVESYRDACKKVTERALFAIEIARRNNWLLDIALDHLSLGCGSLGLALTSQVSTDFSVAGEHLDQAVDGLRQAAHVDSLPRGLLARATFRRVCGNASAAASDLREVEEIADRGHMLLYLADAHLEWTRLHLQTGDREAARSHIEKARELVTSTGYGRRDREVAYLERRLAE